MKDILSEFMRPLRDGLEPAASSLGIEAETLCQVLAVLVLLALVVRIRIAGRHWKTQKEGVGTIASSTRWPRRIGLVTLVLFFGGFGTWSTIAPLASAALAPGVVSPDGSRKTVQHLEGGIVKSIHTGEGELVQAGDVLVSLEDIRARAEFEELQERLAFLLAEEARLLAELSGAPRVTFPDELEHLGETGQTAIDAEQNQFRTRVETLAGRQRILRLREAQLEEQNAGLMEVVESETFQLSLIAEEITVVRDLVGKGLERKARLLLLQRQEAEIAASRSANRAMIARNRQQIGETEYQWFALLAQVQEQVASDLARVRGELASLRSQLPSRLDRLKRNDIRAPITGRVMNVRITTEQGGVIAPGAPILEIVPEDAPLVVDARLSPADIDVVRPGQSARVLLTAYAQRNLPQISGTLRSVSADRLVDDKSGQPYFLAQVEVDPATLQGFGADLELTPGMSADVMILTGERTMLDYLLRPFIESFTKSFRES